MQCSVCGQWKRLHGKDEQGIAIQRFYSCCGKNGEHVHEKEVCDECCKKNCPYKNKKDELPTLQQTDKRIDRTNGAAKISEALKPVQKESRQGNSG